MKYSSPERKKIVEQQFWDEKNLAYNNMIQGYLNDLKYYGAIGQDVKGIDLKTGKQIIDKDYQEQVLTPDEEMPNTFNQPNNPMTTNVASGQSSAITVSVNGKEYQVTNENFDSQPQEVKNAALAKVKRNG